jgi:hypothetical protein
LKRLSRANTLGRSISEDEEKVLKIDTRLMAEKSKGSLFPVVRYLRLNQGTLTEGGGSVQLTFSLR